MYSMTSSDSEYTTPHSFNVRTGYLQFIVHLLLKGVLLKGVTVHEQHDISRLKPDFGYTAKFVTFQNLTMSLSLLHSLPCRS